MVTDESRYNKRKLYVLNYAKQVGDVKNACRYFGIARSTVTPYGKPVVNKGQDRLKKVVVLFLIFSCDEMDDHDTVVPTIADLFRFKSFRSG